MSPIEKEFSDITAEMEFEDSLLSDFELREIQDQKYAFGSFSVCSSTLLIGTGCFLYALRNIQSNIIKHD